MPGERGSIKFPKRYKQLISYEGLERHRKITPTDIDGFIDYNGNAFLYIEGKHIDKYTSCGLDYGQKKAIQNLVNSNEKAGHTATGIVFVHDCTHDEIIIAKDKPVVEIYFNYKWSSISNCSVIHAIERFESYCRNQNINI